MQKPTDPVQTKKFSEILNIPYPNLGNTQLALIVEKSSNLQCSNRP